MIGFARYIVVAVIVGLLFSAPRVCAALIAALWTEIYLAMPAIQAQGEGYDVYAVTDASGGVSAEAHNMAHTADDPGRLGHCVRLGDATPFFGW